MVVAEGVGAGASLKGLSMESGETVSMDARSDIPLGHKIALKNLADGDTAIKYGEDIGKIIADIPQGGHVHTHNCKTKRW